MIAPLFAGLLVLLVLSESFSPPPPTSSATRQEQQEIRSDEGDAGSGATPSQGLSTVFNQPIPSPTTQARKDSDIEHRKKSSFDYNALAVTVFTGVLALVAYLQLRATRKQAEYMRDGLRVTQQSADAAKESADAAMQSVLTTKVLNRARIVVEKLVFHDVSNVNSLTFRYDYKIKNTGKTTAYVFECLDAPSILDDRLPLPENPPYRGEPTSRGYTLGPEQAVKFGTKAFEKAQFDLNKLDNGTWKLYALGYIRYRDDFGSEWRTRYGRQYGERAFVAATIAIAGYDDATSGDA